MHGVKQQKIQSGISRGLIGETPYGAFQRPFDTFVSAENLSDTIRKEIVDPLEQTDYQ
jgi:hypothetical protein